MLCQRYHRQGDKGKWENRELMKGAFRIPQVPCFSSGGPDPGFRCEGSSLRTSPWRASFSKNLGLVILRYGDYLD